MFGYNVNLKEIQQVVIIELTNILVHHHITLQTLMVGT